ncbi:hypothetical protein [Aureimonas sp. AU22]|uniref:hypothetical protein n=1 Tax=Aureimonas sp. AU22 TaxID=1638162 RepID=UPI000784703E|nr:hypothetical protein [Aureimonas sp. AU22]
MTYDLVELRKAKFAKYDILFKRIIDPERSMLREMLGLVRARSLPTEFAGFPPRSVDALFWKRGWYHHVEFQTRDHATMRWRMLEYYWLIAKHRYKLRTGVDPRIKQKVLYVGNGTSGMASTISAGVLDYEFQLLDLESFNDDWADRLLRSTEPSDIVLGLLCRPFLEPDDWTEAYRKEWKRAARIVSREAEIDPFHAGDGPALLLVAALLKKVPEDVKRSLEMAIRVDVQQSKLFTQVFDEGEDSGRVKMALRMIQKHAQQNGILLDKETQERLTELDADVLEDLAYDFRGGADIVELVARAGHSVDGDAIEFDGW